MFSGIMGIWNFIALALLLNFVIKMRVAAQACHCLAEARQNNALELLLSTPLTVEEIIIGQFRALRKIFLFPVMAIAIVEAIVVVGGLATTGDTEGTMMTAFFFVPVYFCIFALDMIAVSWMGMCHALSCKKESQAVNKTIFIVLILPLFSAVTGCLAFLVILVWPIIWIAKGNSKLRGEFRKMAEERYSPPLATAVWAAADGAKYPYEPRERR
jgi:ABC-type Na+ efflux pump permease subunit